MAETLRVDNPFTGELACEVPLVSEGELDPILQRARRAHLEWRRVSIGERVKLIERFVQAFDSERDRYAREITAMMGKPLRQSNNEINGMIDRSRQMAAMAEEALRFHIEGMIEDGEPLPRPSRFEQIMSDPDNRGSVALLVDISEGLTRKSA